MKLILSGGGSGEETKEIDGLFAGLVDKSKPLLYIPIAMDSNKYPYSECLKWLKGTFTSMGILNYKMWTEKELSRRKEVGPNDFGGIYIGGGNTFYLMKILKESGAWDFIKKAVEKDIPIYGGSAGAMIFAKTITPALKGDRNKVRLSDFSAMNMINNWELWCHYEERMDNDIQKYIQKYNFEKIVALTEGNGLYITNQGIKLEGQKPAQVFVNGVKKELKIREALV